MKRVRILDANHFRLQPLFIRQRNDGWCSEQNGNHAAVLGEKRLFWAIADRKASGGRGASAVAGQPDERGGEVKGRNRSASFWGSACCLL
jgi:hypothetical protein